MNLERKIYWRTFFNEIKGPIKVVLTLIIIIFWLPVLLHYTTDYFGPDKSMDDKVGPWVISFGVGITVGMIVFAVSMKIIEAVNSWLRSIRVKAFNTLRDIEAKEEAKERQATRQRTLNPRIGFFTLPPGRGEDKPERKVVKKKQKAQRKILVEAVKSSSVKNRLDAIDIG